ncbi:uncharacterized protein LOC106454158 [Brassica napus]|uniref:uncharacterized protein LOC106454158 n=1 Tax=Brassica napus TaxID=3708 RepID=UPI0020794C61|nr:uncharacterized protein LOC106454158 [Brassica napus]
MDFVSQTLTTDSNLQCDSMFLELHDFANIVNGLHDTCFLKVLDFGGLQNVHCARKEVTKVEFTLRDINNHRINCCIFGNLADILTKAVKQPNYGDICLIIYAKINNYKGELQVSNAFDTSLVLINPDIKEAKSLKQMFHGDANAVDLYQHKNDKILIQKQSKKWSHYPFKTIQEIKHSDKGGNCRVICTVYAIDTSSGWYYLDCMVCKNKVQVGFACAGSNCYKFHDDSMSIVETSEEGKYIVSQANNGTGQKLTGWEAVEVNKCKVVATIYAIDTDYACIRYKLHLMAKDDTAKAKFVEDPQLLPGCINEIVGKTYNFGVTIKKESETFKVSLLTYSDEISSKMATPSKRSVDDIVDIPDNTSTSKMRPVKNIKIEKMSSDELGLTEN